MMDLIIENATLVDGSGGVPRTSDIGIQGAFIVEIGKLPSVAAARRIDACRKVVCPGFIDVHSHADLTLFRDDSADLLTPLVRQGITTFVGGNCGMALAPIGKDFRESAKAYFEMFTQMDFETDVRWRTMAEFMDYSKKKGLLLNTALLTPHGVIRIAATGFNDRPADDREIDIMKRLLIESMEAGAFGLSTGLQYMPGSRSDTRELINLAKSLKAYNGLFTCHLRSYASNTLKQAMDEVAEISQKNDIHGHISHIFSAPWMGPFQKSGLKVLKWLATHPETAVRWLPDAVLDAEMNRILKYLEKKRGMDVNMTMDVMPTTAGFTHLLAFFPPWALTGGREDVIARLRDPAIRVQIRRDIETGRPIWPHLGRNDWSLNIMRLLGWDSVTIMAVHSEMNKHLEGRRFTDIAAETGKHPFDAMCDLLLEEDGRVLVFESLSEPDDIFTESYTLPAIRDSRTMITTDTILLGMGKPSFLFYGCYPKFINRYVKQMGLIELPQAIARCTSLPAEEFGIQKRGRVREGYFADLLVLDEERFSTRAVFRNPEQYPEGLDMVLINGRVVVEHGAVQKGTLAGMMLKKNEQP